MSPAFDVMKRTARFLRWSWLLLPSDLDTSADKDGAAVCLLDDDLSVLKATSRLLSFGWQAKSFSDQLAFLRHAQAYSPLVAVIDVSMPLMNGLGVQRGLCELSPATRVIFLTGKETRGRCA